MPHHYRKMADFHEYYSGAKVAPYLTVFIGGNHEASNHLFELYYGGWVAPNIYYMGAANILRFGPLRIAGLSGIWKGYDYRKQHFERLPYSEDETKTIFHVRELDVRKLLSVRSQVDIGLSHDWPQGVEYLGDYEWLFRKKQGFKDDAEVGKLGSVAARQCLDRLRPAYWFSAHLHTKYPAIVEHGEYEPVHHTSNPRFTQNNSAHHPNNIFSGIASPSNDNNAQSSRKNGVADIVRSGQGRIFATPTQDKPKVSAWQNFHVGAKLADMAERDLILQEQKNSKDEEEITGKRIQPQYVFNETFKKVKLDDSLGRSVTFVEQEERGPEYISDVSNLDGCGSSKLNLLKRSGDFCNPDEIDVDDSDEESVRPMPVASPTHSKSDGPTINSATVNDPVKNPDAIDVNMSDEESESEKNTVNPPAFTDPILPTYSDETSSTAATYIAATTQHKQMPNSILTDASEECGVGPNSGTILSTPMDSISSVVETESTWRESQQLLEDDDPENKGKLKIEGPSSSELVVAEEIPHDVRSQLAELSSDFAPPQKIETSPTLPLPEAISNKTTKFLALGKCETYQEFLQLLEVGAISEDSGMHSQRPFKLSYDPEWLAILRVFAPELTLGGQPHDVVPRHRGETYYRDRIVEEEKWIDEHVVQPAKLEIPANFTITAPIYDPDLHIDPQDMPREVTNPQTNVFCGLIGIDNPFDIGEDERDARMASGSRQQSSNGWRRGGRGHSQVGGRGRGGRGGRGGGGGRRGGGRGWR
jgi:lariat debranching enzyme